MQIQNVNGVKKIYLEINDCLHDDAAERLLGTFIEKDAYDTLVDSDADVYAPANLEGDAEMIMSFRKGVFPKKITEAAYIGLHNAVGRTENRGLAAGPREQIGALGTRDWVLGADGKPTGQVYKKGSGEISDTHYAVPVESGLAGYFDRYVRIPYCRQTSYTRDNEPEFIKSLPFLQAISEQFRILHPTRWANQKKVADATTADFVIPKTVFTTITVNRTFRTACHRDAGDLQEGFGNITVLEHGKYDGAFLCMPKFRIACDIREGDVMLFNSHEIHGNMPIHPIDGGERISLVCYYREKMGQCQSRIYEQTRFRFVEKYRKDAELADLKQTQNGVWAGMWSSPEWHQYLLDSGLLDEAQRDFPALYAPRHDLSEFF